MRRKLFILVFTGLFVTLLCVVLFSPFRFHEQFQKECVAYTVVINAPTDSVFAYLGDSGHAREWSSFVHHITPLNSSEVPDGQVGSRRRCFKSADETGTIWDELILDVQQGAFRHLVCYDLHGFLLTVDTLETMQLYKCLAPNKTELSFTVFYSTEQSSWVWFKTKMAAWVIREIFRKNLRNIKRLTEAKYR